LPLRKHFGRSLFLDGIMAESFSASTVILHINSKGAKLFGKNRAAGNLHRLPVSKVGS
jgi:hypothetical protein